MDLNQSTHLLDLPTEMLEKIVNYLPMVEIRKNLRSTCKLLHHLCNSERFCRKEVIKWSEESQSNILSAFQNSIRGCFNLIFRHVNINQPQILAFFVQHGAKIQSLNFINCDFSPGFVESIIVQCEALCSLTGTMPASHFSFESNRVTRPTVTSLELTFDYIMVCQSPDIFHRISSVFPCVKHLSIAILRGDVEDRYCVSDLVFLNFAKNFSHLESLELDIKLLTSFSPDQNFLSSLPISDRLSLDFECNFQDPSSFWNTLAAQLNVSSIELDLGTRYADNIEALLSVTSLKHLSYHSMDTMHLNIKVFEAFVSSQLKTIRLSCNNVLASGTLTDLQIKVNETVTDMYVDWSPFHDVNNQPLTLLFPTHFHGLIHLQIEVVNDEILRSIFKHQKNLRSLVLMNCGNCTVAGFCGTYDTQFECCLTNLQKLEHLSLKGVRSFVIQSELFQTAFNFPRLKYLKINTEEEEDGFSFPKMIDMLKPCVNLEALYLGYFAVPSNSTLLSLHQNLKHLNYLRIVHLEFEKFTFSYFYVNLKHFHWVDSEKWRSSWCFVDYNERLDRTVIIHDSEAPYICFPLYSPSISSYAIPWITVTD